MTEDGRNRVLLVEDDEGVSDAVALGLQYAGYDWAAFDDGTAAAEYLRRDHAFDLALLDIMLPGMDGFSLLTLLRQYAIPVICLTALTDTAFEIRGLRGGAEDYIGKPFEMMSLLVRMEKVLARSGRLPDTCRVNGLTIDRARREDSRGGVAVPLTPLEFDVLALLVRNRNRTVTREQLLNEIWGQDFFGDTRTVDVRIANLRKKLGPGNGIHTVSRVGYRLEEADGGGEDGP